MQTTLGDRIKTQEYNIYLNSNHTPFKNTNLSFMRNEQFYIIECQQQLIWKIWRNLTLNL